MRLAWAVIEKRRRNMVAANWHLHQVEEDEDTCANIAQDVYYFKS